MAASFRIPHHLDAFCHKLSDPSQINAKTVSQRRRSSHLDPSSSTPPPLLREQMMAAVLLPVAMALERTCLPCRLALLDHLGRLGLYLYLIATTRSCLVSD